MKEKDLEKIIKAIANRRRLAILKYIDKSKEARVSDIAEAIKLSFKATSKHLGILRAADIVDYEQRGVEYYYRLADPFPGLVRTALSHL